MPWQTILFGWPSAIACIGLSLTGLSYRRPAVLAAGSLAGLGFLFYVSMTNLWPAGLIAIASQIGAPIALRRGRAGWRGCSPFRR
jgi:hypothetical protein